MGTNAVVHPTSGEYEILEQYRYTEYGEPTFCSGDGVPRSPNASQADQDYLFTGRQWDAELGTYYCRARYYDQRGGRFLARDAIGMDVHNNLYAYVSDCPTQFIDPYGLQESRPAVEFNWTVPGHIASEGKAVILAMIMIIAFTDDKDPTGGWDGIDMHEPGRGSYDYDRKRWVLGWAFLQEQAKGSDWRVTICNIAATILHEREHFKHPAKGHGSVMRAAAHQLERIPFCKGVLGELTSNKGWWKQKALSMTRWVDGPKKEEEVEKDIEEDQNSRNISTGGTPTGKIEDGGCGMPLGVDEPILAPPVSFVNVPAEGKRSRHGAGPRGSWSPSVAPPSNGVLIFGEITYTVEFGK